MYSDCVNLGVHRHIYYEKIWPRSTTLTFNVHKTDRLCPPNIQNGRLSDIGVVGAYGTGGVVEETEVPSCTCNSLHQLLPVLNF